jgi:uncharacterized coiled-coil protein SlyX
VRQSSRPEIWSGTVSCKRNETRQARIGELEIVLAFEVAGLDMAGMTVHQAKVCKLLNKLNRLVEEKHASESINAKRRVEI